MATVTMPSFSGLKFGSCATPSRLSTTTKTSVAPPKLAVKASLRDFGAVIAATAATVVLAGNAMAMEVLLGGDDGSLAFVPNDFTVAKGEKIVFKNNAGFPHNVVFDEDEVPSGVDASAISMPEEDLLNSKDEVYAVTLNEPGTYSFYCAPHQGAGMVGRVTVK